jgi:hypothetical protein
MDIFCADIGSVRSNNFGWFGRHEEGTTEEGSDIAALGTAVANRLDSGRNVCLGFEAPLFVPLRSEPLEMTRCRAGETSPNWIGGPGAAVLATALAQVPWILRDIRSKTRATPSATMNWEEFQSRSATLFLWEAFVSGPAKGANHIRDAEVAVNAFREALPDPVLANAITEETVTSMLAVAMLRTGWSVDISLLRQRCLVIRARPPS